MSTTTANPQGSSTVQAPLWNQRARDWAELQEPGQRRLFETELELASQKAALGVDVADHHAGDVCIGDADE